MTKFWLKLKTIPKDSKVAIWLMNWLGCKQEKKEK